jgi:hypothetical protein
MPALADPAALVTDVEGEISPSVELFQEVESGTELAVGAGARLTLEHYASCQTVTMTGGIVAVRDTGFGLDRADVAGRMDTPCAETIALQAQDSVSASVVVRGAFVGGNGVPRVPLAPQIVIAGDGGYDKMRVERDGEAIWTLAVRAGRVEWPLGRLFLTDESFYVLVLTGPAGERRARVVADRDEGGRTVLRP